MATSRIPLWLKIGWTVWIAIWMPAYWWHYGPKNFLWFCDLGNFLITVALWTESPLIISWQACSVFLVQILFTIDVVVRVLFGVHPIGGTEYMFNDDHSNIPLAMRLLSLFHVVTPPVLLWTIWKLGFDRRGILCQILTAWVVLPICWLGWDETVNLNWVWGPLGRPQYVVKPPWLYLLLCLAAYPLILYLPTHLVLSKFFRKKEST
jgi:hypothetical protein